MKNQKNETRQEEEKGRERERERKAGINLQKVGRMQDKIESRARGGNYIV